MSEIANVEMAAAWDGEEGDDWTVNEQRHNDAVRAHSERLMTALAVGRAEHVLDVGCGTGKTTRQAARAAVDGDALGVDLSAKMLERARERAVEEGLTNVEFVQGDAQVTEFAPASFDAVVSLMGTMFFADPVAAFTNLGAATRPGGRMVLLTWQELARNEWVGTVRDTFAFGRTLPTPPSGAPGPFGLSDPDHVRRTLELAGWRDVELDDVQVPFRAGADADDAYAFVVRHRASCGAWSRISTPTSAAPAFDALRAPRRHARHAFGRRCGLRFRRVDHPRGAGAVGVCRARDRQRRPGRAWDGPAGDAWVAREEAPEQFVDALHRATARCRGVGASERVLDIGCGTGETTRLCARLGRSPARSLGVDLSTAMLERARSVPSRRVSTT